LHLGDTTRFTERVAEVQWGLMVCVYCLSYVPALMLLRIDGYGAPPLLLGLFLALVVLGAEALHDIADLPPPVVLQDRPLVWEFTVIALAGAALGASACAMSPFTVLQAAGLGMIIAAMGLAGSLVMEAIKRDRGVEQWRRTVRAERHGPGLLGRLERIVFAAPVFFHLVRFWWTV
jgi:phosphatidate cytidylyltransferase